MPHRARLALAGAAGLVVMLVVVWFASFHLEAVRHADLSILRGFGGLGKRPRVSALARFLANLCDPNPYIYFCAIPIGLALARRRIWVAVAVGAILLGANVTTQLLKPLLPGVRPGYLTGLGIAPATGSWPSGHATAAMAFALCLVLAVPRRLRPAAATAGAAFAVGVSYSFLSLRWHYPSDVLGGFLVAAAWTLLGIAAIWTAYSRRLLGVPAPAGDPSPQPTVLEALGPPSLALAAAVALVAIAVLARPREAVAYVSAHHAFVVGAAGIGALGFALATGVMLAVRRSR